MATAGTAAQKTESKRYTYIASPIKISNDRNGMVMVRGDVADRFNITAATAATSPDVVEGFRKVSRDTTKRKLYLDASTAGATITADSAGSTTEVFYLPPKLTAGGAGGVKIQVPIGLTSTSAKGTISKRLTTITFPSGCNLAAISIWLHEKCAANKPAYFITKRGVKRAVIPGGTATKADPNPGNSATPPPV